MRRASLVLSLASVLAGGCGLLLDLDPPDPQSSFDATTPPPRDGGSGDAAVDAGMDAGPGPCDDDGARCSLGHQDGICVGGVCAPSRCGDGVHDPRSEDCDEGNDIDDDECPIDCTFDCELASDCPAVPPRPCRGAIACVGRRCVQPPLGDGTPCSRGGEEGMCRGGLCAAPLCGNGVTDAGEQCDDGNDVGGDGCEADCTFTCETDDDCDDGRFCNGAERCMNSTHTCRSTPVSCDGNDACRASHCDPATDACVVANVDRDLDGYLCPEDCAPMDGSIHPGAAERCNAVDDDCDGRIDEDAGSLRCFPDEDGDGYGAGAGVRRCECAAGEVSAGGDCYDDPSDPLAPMVSPAVTMFRRESYATATTRSWDWNCDGVEDVAFDRNVDITGVPPPCDLPATPGICRPDPVWESDAIPSCGDAAPAYVCAFVAAVCLRQRVEDHPQLCR